MIKVRNPVVSSVLQRYGFVKVRSEEGRIPHNPPSFLECYMCECCYMCDNCRRGKTGKVVVYDIFTSPKGVTMRQAKKFAHKAMEAFRSS